ncbi:hypothetical protein [Candidatus Nitrospira allomarina]|jgi:hypothetical protein|uniref:Uncharacterized protein n=1 Tax=Candidatus Nitrospira allomarina TaxID=3020900 RepID=A0AA96JWR3_9BACT|nr:hypothetical protein [Candidatus Nitrospira allomarina]WNM58201.1 hypothetical protein PP769_00140 [Candidatus Nitrospira allomarina]
MKWIDISFLLSRACDKKFAGFLVCAIFGTVAWFPLAWGFTSSSNFPHNGPKEFSARLMWKTGGRIANAQLFVKNDRYRIEPAGGIRTELGYASILIIRLDEQKTWYVFSQRRMIVSVPLTLDYLLPFSAKLEGETSRTVIGESVVGDQSALLYDVEVQDRFGQLERYFEWVDPQREILLKLLSQDRDWFVEYRHVVVSSQPDYYFEAPLGYRIIEAQEAPIPRG